jgi:hypothetical protein
MDGQADRDAQLGIRPPDRTDHRLATMRHCTNGSKEDSRKLHWEVECDLPSAIGLPRLSLQVVLVVDIAMVVAQCCRLNVYKGKELLRRSTSQGGDEIQGDVPWLSRIFEAVPSRSTLKLVPPEADRQA